MNKKYSIFVEFMLQMICDVLKEISETQSDIDVADDVVVNVVQMNIMLLNC